ncbi:MAG: hypothetical protein PHZ11_10720 [Desulfitobacteriaceae bacterium]|nr:hypothetical protein [Desulfitobacteriaceae bacterium]
MDDKILEEYKLYYAARAEKYKNNPEYANSYKTEKQLSDAMQACSSLEDFKDVELYTSKGKAFDMDKIYLVVMNNYMSSIYQYKHKDPGQGLFHNSAESTIEYLKELKNIPSYRGGQRVEMVK